MLLYFAYCDFEETRVKFEKVHSIYQRFLDIEDIDPTLVRKSTEMSPPKSTDIYCPFITFCHYFSNLSEFSESTLLLVTIFSFHKILNFLLLFFELVMWLESFCIIIQSILSHLLAEMRIMSGLTPNLIAIFQVLSFYSWLLKHYSHFIIQCIHDLFPPVHSILYRFYIYHYT